MLLALILISAPFLIFNTPKDKLSTTMLDPEPPVSSVGIENTLVPRMCCAPPPKYVRPEVCTNVP